MSKACKLVRQSSMHARWFVFSRTCLQAYNDTECGLLYSTADQVGFCGVAEPPLWPALLDVPQVGGCSDEGTRACRLVDITQRGQLGCWACTVWPLRRFRVAAALLLCFAQVGSLLAHQKGSIRVTLLTESQLLLQP